MNFEADTVSLIPPLAGLVPAIHVFPQFFGAVPRCGWPGQARSRGTCDCSSVCLCSRFRLTRQPAMTKGKRNNIGIRSAVSAYPLRPLRWCFLFNSPPHSLIVDFTFANAGG